MNDTVVAMVLSAGIGLGIFVMLRAMRRRPVALDPLGFGQRRARTPLAVPGLEREAPPDIGPLQRHLGRPGVRVLETLGMADRGLLREQLQILDRSLERHAYEKMLAAIVGVLLPILIGLSLGAQGFTVSPLLIVLGSLVLGGLGFLYPDLPLAEQVEARQEAFRHALASYLDLVTIILAGGGGTESALVGAAEAGEGWVFAELRGALRRGELSGRSPWEMFEELGARYGIDDLRELAASISLAGGQGAKVRQSLVSKAGALRAQQMAEVEARAEANTEKMIVPVSIMVLGLMLFIGRGAIAAIGSGSSSGGVPSSGSFSTQTTEQGESP